MLNTALLNFRCCMVVNSLENRLSDQAKEGKRVVSIAFNKPSFVCSLCIHLGKGVILK